MLSENILAFDDKPPARLFICIRNKSGPSMEPSGIPSTRDEVCPLTTTLKKLDKFKRLSDMPFWFSLNIMPSSHTLSNDVSYSNWLVQKSSSIKPD